MQYQGGVSPGCSAAVSRPGAAVEFCRRFFSSQSLKKDRDFLRILDSADMLTLSCDRRHEGQTQTQPGRERERQRETHAAPLEPV
jgi:hypothetical protein